MPDSIALPGIFNCIRRMVPSAQEQMTI